MWSLIYYKVLSIETGLVRTSKDQKLLDCFKAEFVLYRLPRVLSANYLRSFFILLKIILRTFHYSIRPKVLDYRYDSNVLNSEVIVLNVNAGFYRESLLNVKNILSEVCKVSVLVLYTVGIDKCNFFKVGFVREICNFLNDYDKPISFIKKISIALEFNFLLTCERNRYKVLDSFSFNNSSRCIITNDFADPRSRFFILTAQESGLKIFLVQQGLVSESYLEWDLNLADVTFCGGSRSQKVIEYQNPSLKLVSTGLPNFDDVIKRSSESKKYRNILFATQPFFPGSFESNVHRIRIFFSGIFAFLLFTRSTITIKPHPSDTTNYKLFFFLPSVLTRRLRFVDRSCSIEESIQSCDVIVTSYSQSSIFAIVQDKPAIFLYFAKNRHRIDFIYSGVGEYFESLSSLIKFLRLNRDLSNLKVNKTMLEDYIGVLDGRAGHRIASYVLSELSLRTSK